jgi:ferric-dicitrate binding protein FerR (iron transport regulator)
MVRQTQALDKTNEVDVEAVVAWRFGYFQFNNADLPVVMRQLERWYDVQAVYEGNIPKREFLGKIPRNYTLSQALDVLKMLQVHFKIEGKKIIVSP